MLFLLACATLTDETWTDNVLGGELVVSGATEFGDAYIFLFDAADPPPPSGTGSPLNFTTVPAQELAEGGMAAASYLLPGVPDGSYLLTALMDVDGDFQPLLSSNAGATCGDWAGGYLSDLATSTFGVVTVSGGELRDDLTVLIGAEMTTERPAFTLPSATVDRAGAVGQPFSLQSSAIFSALVSLTGPFDGTDLCDTAFLVLVEDANGDSVPDPHPNADYAAAGAYNIWPRVYYRMVAESDAGEESWVGEAIIYPDFLATGAVALNTPTPLTSLTALFVPSVLHTSPDGQTEVVSGTDMPAGSWAVTVVSVTGQTWTVPNETAAAASISTSFDPATQGVGLLVE